MINYRFSCCLWNRACMGNEPFRPFIFSCYRINANIQITFSFTPVLKKKKNRRLIMTVDCCTCRNPSNPRIYSAHLLSCSRKSFKMQIKYQRYLINFSLSRSLSTLNSLAGTVNTKTERYGISAHQFSDNLSEHCPSIIYRLSEKDTEINHIYWFAG